MKMTLRVKFPAFGVSEDPLCQAHTFKFLWSDGRSDGSWVVYMPKGCIVCEV